MMQKYTTTSASLICFLPCLFVAVAATAGSIDSYSWNFDDSVSASNSASVMIVENARTACVPTPGNGPQTHADCITDYTGPEVCFE